LSELLARKNKVDMIAKLTETMVAIEGKGMRQVTWVKTEEVPEGRWGIAVSL